MNRNRTLLLGILVLVIQAVSGQELYTHGTSADLHVLHTVEGKETWYSIAKKYNLLPKEIATFNNLSIDRPLEIGQSLKVPLTRSNFSQEDPSGSVDDLVPVYHIVQDKEWMYRISVNHHKVPIEKLERWNNITRDEAKSGKKLIVGFFTTKNPVETAKVDTPKMEVSKTTTVSRQVQIPSVSNTPAAPANVPKDGGYFKMQFDENGKNRTGFSGIFKSTSGWNDGKYYALMNNVTIGTIVKVNFPSTNKFIYAKVLGELPDMKESAGLALRISDAAAKELGAVSSKFNVEVKF
ncbi:MAG TPA: LysM peptidoglycan-binding domain-containing protein [Flavitalea sp.]|nr:LysM peptidoglycan-binding domain-containing protein [Flavitalea sp.]